MNFYLLCMDFLRISGSPFILRYSTAFFTFTRSEKATCLRKVIKKSMQVPAFIKKRRKDTKDRKMNLRMHDKHKTYSFVGKVIGLKISSDNICLVPILSNTTKVEGGKNPDSHNIDK